MAFTANPYKFARTLLDKERSGVLEAPLEEVETYLHETHSDASRNNALRDCERIDPAALPEIELVTTEPTLGEVNEVIKKARFSSAPGPNAIPYKVYKMCPLLLKRLWRLLKVVWRKGEIPDAWKEAEGILTPKERNSKNVNQFRTISLLNVEGKIFFAILARRLTSYLTSNKYINTSIQKGGVPGFSGCVEHTSAISQLIREAKAGKKNLTVVWLDLANAYSSIPHQLIYTSCHPVEVSWMTSLSPQPPIVQSSAIKCLGKWFDASLQDGDNVKKLENQVEDGLKKIDKSNLPGKFKAWLYQHALLPRLIWPMMLYEIPSSKIEALERVTSRHLRKWLGIPPSFSGVGLYGKSNQLQLPFTSLVEEFKTAKTRLVLTLRDSPDEQIREAGIVTRTGRKWSASETVNQAESSLKLKDIVD
ncbi:uncharacterized protein LOC132717462 [Ruditapes philippinarum]|uniref:uncharacterized protein LOC132717462 n=1 Tax=Ruditapes philippinarum TaxID=129788 RepID=UPI00295A7D21|nr:uncharacterized protein LOC132717462 [Ruditapes philippinarum]